MKIINVRENFPYPGPRFKILGDWSGEEFCDLIINEINHDANITINLDGTAGYGSSFLEESFGGLIRRGVDKNIVKNIKFISDEEPEIIDEILEYIEDAIKNLK